MEGFDISTFVTGLVGLMVGVVILSAMITVISGVKVTGDNAEAISAMIGIVPLVAVVGLLMAGIGMFMKKKL